MAVAQINGNWFCQWKVKGKTKRKYFGQDGEAAARFFNQHRVEPKAGKGEAPTFADLAGLWMESSRLHVAVMTTRVRSVQLNAHLIPAFGELPIYDLTPAKMDRYVNQRLLAGIRASSICKELDLVSLTIKFAMKRKYISHNPIDGYDMPDSTSQVITPPTAAEIQAIIAEAPPHIKRAAMLAYYTACRPGPAELFPIRYNQIDWPRNTITIKSANKGGIKSRAVPIHRDLPLREWYVADGEKQDGLLVSYQGKEVFDIGEGWRRVCRRAGVTRKLPFYSMRHAAITAMLHAGTDIKTVAEIAGNTPETILRVYAHVSSPSRCAAIESMPGLQLGVTK